MADLSITPANVRPAAATPQPQMVQLAESVTAGQAIVKLTSATKWSLADANGASDKELRAGQNEIRIALNSGSANDWIASAIPGSEVAIGATVTVGQMYGVSTTAGGIAPVSDITGYTNAYMHVFAQAITTGILRMFKDTWTGAKNGTP
jgi:hypothetical protein